MTSDPDGTNEQILTVPGQPGYEDRAPQWSPDGEMITWMAQENEPCCGDWDIWAMNEDGSGQTNLTFDDEPYGDMFPTWSPDGTEILFQSNRGSGWYMDLFAIPGADRAAAAGRGSRGGRPAAPTGDHRRRHRRRLGTGRRADRSAERAAAGVGLRRCAKRSGDTRHQLRD